MSHREPSTRRRPKTNKNIDSVPKPEGRSIDPTSDKGVCVWGISCGTCWFRCVRVNCLTNPDGVYRDSGHRGAGLYGSKKETEPERYVRPTAYWREERNPRIDWRSEIDGGRGSEANRGACRKLELVRGMDSSGR